MNSEEYLPIFVEIENIAPFKKIRSLHLYLEEIKDLSHTTWKSLISTLNAIYTSGNFEFLEEFGIGFTNLLTDFDDLNKFQMELSIFISKLLPQLKSVSILLEWSSQLIFPIIYQSKSDSLLKFAFETRSIQKINEQNCVRPNEINHFKELCKSLEENEWTLLEFTYFHYFDQTLDRKTIKEFLFILIKKFPFVLVLKVNIFDSSTNEVISLRGFKPILTRYLTEKTRILLSYYVLKKRTGKIFRKEIINEISEKIN